MNIVEPQPIFDRRPKLMHFLQFNKKCTFVVPKQAPSKYYPTSRVAYAATPVAAQKCGPKKYFLLVAVAEVVDSLGTVKCDKATNKYQFRSLHPHGVQPCPVFGVVNADKFPSPPAMGTTCPVGGGSATVIESLTANS